MQQQLQEITFTIESEKRLKEELDNNVKEKVAMQNDVNHSPLCLGAHPQATQGGPRAQSRRVVA
jgi:hypothetical protein